MSAPAPRSALLIDTENLFYSYGHWSERHYEKNFVDPGIRAFVKPVVVDAPAVRRMAQRSLTSLIWWSERKLNLPLNERRSYGKDSDGGVRSVRDAFERNDITHVSVGGGANEADKKLIAELDTQFADIAGLAVGGEDHLVREGVLARCARSPVDFLFVVSAKNLHHLRTRDTTPQLNAANRAVLTQVHRRTHFFATLDEVVIAAEADRRGGSAAAIRAVAAAPESPAATTQPTPPATIEAAPFATPPRLEDLVAFTQVIRGRKRFPTPRSVNMLGERTWRAHLTREARVGAPDLVPMIPAILDRIAEVYSANVAAAQHFDGPGLPEVRGSSWKWSLPAAALFPLVRDGSLSRDQWPEEFALAYDVAKSWLT